MAIDQQRFGQFVAAMRKEKGWTQKQLAARIGVSDKAVSKWERALSLPDISLLEPLAAALGVTVAELLHGERLAAPLEPQQVEALVTGAVQLGQRGFHSDPLRRLRWLGALAAGVACCRAKAGWQAAPLAVCLAWAGLFPLQWAALAVAEAPVLAAESRQERILSRRAAGRIRALGQKAPRVWVITANDGTTLTVAAA